jgi:lipopolysaccharide export system permease protein
MNTYVKFLLINYLKSIGYVFLVIFSFTVILNTLTEVEFFKNYQVASTLPFFLATINSFDSIFEIFPFIFLVSTQVFFINLFKDNQINTFKYFGLKNTKIIAILGLISFFLGILIITIFYSLSSNLKNLYLEEKNKYSYNKYLAVVTNNGLWIKDIVDQKKYIINANKIENNFLHNVSIAEFDKDFDLIRILNSKKIDIKSFEWVLYDVEIIKDNSKIIEDFATLNSNFDYKTITSLFSNLSALSLLELIKLKKNYNQINYSTSEIDSKLQKLISSPIYFGLMTILSAIIMFNSKRFKNNSLKIIIGLFFCVLIYYINNVFYVLGSTEKISLILSIWTMLLLLTFINFVMLSKINEK